MQSIDYLKKVVIIQLLFGRKYRFSKSERLKRFKKKFTHMKKTPLPVREPRHDTTATTLWLFKPHSTQPASFFFNLLFFN